MEADWSSCSDFVIELSDCEISKKFVHVHAPGSASIADVCDCIASDLSEGLPLEPYEKIVGCLASNGAIIIEHREAKFLDGMCVEGDFFIDDLRDGVDGGVDEDV